MGVPTRTPYACKIENLLQLLVSARSLFFNLESRDSDRSWSLPSFCFLWCRTREFAGCALTTCIADKSLQRAKLALPSMSAALQALQEYYRQISISGEEDLNTGVDDVGTEALSKVNQISFCLESLDTPHLAFLPDQETYLVGDLLELQA